MFPSPKLPSKDESGVALVTVLALVVIISLILVAFVTTMRIERTASQSYSQSMTADQLGRGALNLVVGELQNELSKDAPPVLTYPKKPLFTNVTSENIMPQYVGTNAAMPNLVKSSTTIAPYTGSLSSGKLIASATKTWAPARNGRYISLDRWNLPQLGIFPDNASAPNWIMLTRSGATNAASLTFGPTGSTLNNNAPSNPNFAIGRFAYAVYDVGGLLDITQAGYPSSLTAAQIQRIKGTIQGVPVTQTTFSVTQDDLMSWRNPESAAGPAAYVDYVTNYRATNSSGAIYPGDNTFFGRQDLIKAAKDGIAGLTTNALPNLTMFTRDRNAPSWGPTYNATDLGGTNAPAYAYKNNATISTTSPFTSANPNPNRLFPSVRFNSAQTITDYKSDGSTYTYPVEPGDAVVQRRFPLSRLAWVGPNGPNGVSEGVIQACFGLIWRESDDPNLPGAFVWKYVGPTGTTSQQTIKTLDQVAAEGRIPNFFELLQAGVLRGSLAVNGDQGTAVGSAAYGYSTQQRYPVFQILRMGAAAIDQADADSYPTVIEYDQSGYAWQACGVESLPGIVSILPVIGAPSVPVQTEGETSAEAAVYLSFNLWNPHRETPVNAPPIRIRVRGSVGVYNMHGNDALLPESMGANNEPGFLADLDQSIGLTALSSAGFSTPSTILMSDVVGLGPAGQQPANDSGVWVNALPLGNLLKSDVAALRLRNFPFKLGSTSVTTPAPKYDGVKVQLGYDSANPFNATMEFQSLSGAWIPYQHATGMNDPLTWFRIFVANFFVVSSSPRQGGGNTYFANFISYLGGGYPSGWGLNSGNGKVGQSTKNGPDDTPPGTGATSMIQNTWDRSLIFASNDPRSTRFNFWIFTRDSAPVLTAAENMILWSPSNIAAPYQKGLGGSSSLVQRKPTIFGTLYSPAQLSRNNNGSDAAIAGTDNSSTRGNAGVETSYVDSDGLRRIADSGLFVNPDATVGNPFARALDRPAILNRPFRSVGELGSVFRDNPWRTMDLFTAKSADSALLDIFTVQDSTEAVVAGRINLNTRNEDVLKALLTDSVVDPVTGTTYSPAIASTLTTAISQLTSTNKMVNKSDLANLVSPYLSPSNGGTTSGNFASNDDQNIKLRRESFVRALSDVTQTRTWNLMVDVIAQAGRYSQGSTALNEFTVEGERRYWLHIAIDRFTGEVLERNIEVVTE